MRLVIDEDFFCFTKLESELANFSIITGLNGSGKTRLLEALSNPTLNPNESAKIYNNSGDHVRKVSYIQVNSLLANLDITYQNNNINGRARGSDPLNIVWLYYRNTKGSIPEDNFYRGFKNVAKKMGKDVHLLEEADIHNHYSVDDGIPGDVFSVQLGSIICGYAKRKHDNSYNRFENEFEGNKNVVFLTDKEFVELYGGDPLVEFNQLIESCDLPYIIKLSKNKNPISNAIEFSIHFTNLLDGSRHTAMGLSSGEKIIFAIALALYNQSNGVKIFADLLLLDEPDAFLHPSMIKDLMNDLQKVFVDNGVSVIMTTHSPTTVALSPENSKVYLLTKDPSSLTLQTKDEAISQLTVGLPTLSVRIENRRLVFVESKHDVANYEKLFNLLKPLLKTEFSLSFFASDITGNGTCEKVEDLLNKMNGITTVFGVTDYDGKRKEKGNLKVLGNGNRDGIENYILDPLILGIYLLLDLQLSKPEVGLSNEVKISSIEEMTASQLQDFCDQVVDKIFIYQPELIDRKSTFTSIYMNEIELQIPKWFSETDDHDLETFVIKRFPKLTTLKDGNKLSTDIIGKVLTEMPKLIPVDFFHTMRSLVS